MTSLLEVKNLTTQVRSGNQTITIIDDVSISVAPGEVVGLVGESGCGKSVTALAIMGLLKSPAAITGGEVWFKGRNLVDLPREEMRRLRGDSLAMIFQEPMTSLNPTYSVGNQIGEVLRIHRHLRQAAIQREVIALLARVGIPRPEDVIRRYPHQLSGGMRQRVMIAMAMACEPDLLIADEPTTALDVTIQAQVLDLISKLQQATQMAVVFITHDLGVVSEVCDRVVVMYAGRVVETGRTREVLDRPQHPYTQGLLASLESRGSTARRLSFIPGQVPPPAQWGEGCRFADRCPQVMARCRAHRPPEVSRGGEQVVSCWLYDGGHGSDDTAVFAEH